MRVPLWPVDTQVHRVIRRPKALGRGGTYPKLGHVGSRPIYVITSWAGHPTSLLSLPHSPVGCNVLS